MDSLNKINFPYITSVRFINDPKEGIAKSKRATGELVLNKFYWNKLKPEHKVYVVGHESGHIRYNTKDEMLADDYASRLYLNAGGSITESIRALSDHLDRNNPVHIARAWLQYNRALKFDYEHNHNKKTFRPHYDSADDVKRKFLSNGKQ